MKQRDDKVAHAAHIKRNTRGTSNEISFSVLDAAKNAQNDESRSSRKRIHLPRLGSVFLFTLGRVRKPAPTPVKERGLMLSTGEFVSAEGSGKVVSSTPGTVPGVATDGAGTLAGTSGAPGAPNATGTAASANSAAEAIASTAGGSNANTNNAAASVASSALTTALTSGSASASVPPSAKGSLQASSSWRTPADEVARRKASRKRRRRVAIAGLALCVTAAVAVGASLLFAEFQNQQEKKGQVEDRIGQVLSMDDSFATFDEHVSTILQLPLVQLATDEVDGAGVAENARNMIPETRQKVTDMRGDIERLQPTIDNVKDAEILNQAISVLKARENMLNSGEEVLAAYSAFQETYGQVGEGWNAVLEGDAAARDAAALVEETNTANVEASIEKSNEAIALFEQASTVFQSAQQSQSVDLSAYVEYLSLRIEAEYAAIASDQAYLNRNKEEIAAQNDRYNELDAQAVALIKEQPANPLELVEQDFAAAIEQSAATYENERALAAGSRAILLDYLGTISK